jgi:hypothetical protein
MLHALAASLICVLNRESGHKCSISEIARSSSTLTKLRIIITIIRVNLEEQAARVITKTPQNPLNYQTQQRQPLSPSELDEQVITKKRQISSKNF